MTYTTSSLRTADPVIPTGVEIFLLVVAGFLVRLTRLRDSLWYDEIAAWREYGQHGPGMIFGTWSDPANHVLHTFFSRISYLRLEHVLGTEAAIRLPALLFSLAAIPVLYSLVRQIAGARAGRIAGLLAAILPVLVLSGTEARGYAQMIFFSACCLWLFVRGLETRQWRWWMLYALSAALGAWSHPVSVLLPIGHGAWLLWSSWKGMPRAECVPPAMALVASAVLTILAYAPIIMWYIGLETEQAHAIMHALSSTDGNEPSPLGIETGRALLQMGGSWYMACALPGLFLLAVGLRRARFSPRLSRLTLLALMGGPIFWAVILVAGSWIYARFLLFCLPGAVILVSVGLDQCFMKARTVGWIMLLLILGCSMADLATRPVKQPLRDAAEAVRQVRGEDEETLVIGLRSEVMDVYAGDLAQVFVPLHGESYRGRDLRSVLLEHRPAWAIVLYPESVSGENHALLEEHGYREYQRLPGWVDWVNGDVLVLKR